MSDKIRPDHLERAAYVYVRQSSLQQVRHHREGQQRQYGLADRARELGFVRVVVIDEDLGTSGSGKHTRPGFGRLLTAVCEGTVGAVFALEASRLARNNRDWHHLIDLCGMTETVLVDDDGIYDPRLINDRLLLGLKGTMSVRWQTADRSLVRDAAAFLVTTATRLAINVIQSARSRREMYVGPWLPEPVDTSADPGLEAERGEGLEAGILLLMEKLSPTERAAYILREAFDYPYRDIANVLRLEEANARQVVTRARQHVAHDRRMPASSTEQRHLLDAFVAAAQNGDVAGLEGLFASDVVSTLDGARLVRSA